MVERIVSDIEQVGWSQLPAFLSPAQLQAMHQFFELHRPQFRPAQVGQGQERQRVEKIRGDYTFWLDPLEPTGPWLELNQFLSQLILALNQNCFLGLKQFEYHLAEYPPGTYYQKHLDHFHSDSSRSLSFVFYLNQTWSPELGGELVLYDRQDMVLNKVLPSPGTAVFFLSQEFPHEVLPATQARRSLTGWVHTKNIY
jgi:SM-20-related protein